MERWRAGPSFAAFLIFLAAPASWAQKTGPPPPSTQPPGNSPSGPIGPPQVVPFQAPIFVYGRILMDDGHPVPEPVSVELRCPPDLIQAVRPDLNGHFQFTLGEGPQENMARSASNETPMTIESANAGAPDSSTGPTVRSSFCELQTSVPGFQPVSKYVRLDAHEAGGIDAGIMILTRIASAKGSAVSVTSLAAPSKARKEFEKGYNDARRNRLESATRHLQKAVADYENYAVAWNELGKIYFYSHQTDQARQSFTRAVAADPQYIQPCLALAELELKTEHYGDAIEAAGKALKLDPGIVSASFIQAAANFKLNRLDDAEKIARDAANTSHQKFPQLHVLLANIDLRKKDFSNAETEMRAYLNESPKGTLATEVRNRLKDLEDFEANAQKTASIPQPRVPTTESTVAPSKRIGAAVLRVYLRMQDDYRFIGLANVHMAASDGHEIAGSPGADGEFSFANLAPGNYNVEVSASGFMTIHKKIEIEPDSQIKTAFLIMTPQPPTPAAIQGGLSPSSDDFSSAAGSSELPFKRPGADDVALEVARGVACPLTIVLKRAPGQRIRKQSTEIRRHRASVELHINRRREAPET
jgi:tetratricopeptide (TPR) repeat protein